MKYGSVIVKASRCVSSVRTLLAENLPIKLYCVASPLAFPIDNRKVHDHNLSAFRDHPITATSTPSPHQILGTFFDTLQYFYLVNGNVSKQVRCALWKLQNDKQKYRMNHGDPNVSIYKNDANLQTPCQLRFYLLHKGRTTHK